MIRLTCVWNGRSHLIKDQCFPALQQLSAIQTNIIPPSQLSDGHNIMIMCGWPSLMDAGAAISLHHNWKVINEHCSAWQSHVSLQRKLHSASEPIILIKRFCVSASFCGW